MVIDGDEPEVLIFFFSLRPCNGLCGCFPFNLFFFFFVPLLTICIIMFMVPRPLFTVLSLMHFYFSLVIRLSLSFNRIVLAGF